MAVFELGGAWASAIPELTVGPWQYAPRGIASFDADPGPPDSVWRVELACDDAASRAALDGGARSVARTHAVLDDMPGRIERALAAAGRASNLASRGPGTIARELPPAESALVAALTGAEAHGPLPSELLAWSAGAPASSGSSSGRLERMLEDVADLARGRARVETRIAGALVAHSVMTLSGDTELWAAPRLSPVDARLHARAVAVAVRTRHAWARILTLIVRGCGRLLVLGLPTSGLAALPLVWRFLRDLLREVRDRNPAPRPAA